MASPEERQAAVGKAFRTSIAFYGRVLDQHDNPVPNADVKCYVNGLRRDPPRELKSDLDEYFSKGATGISLGVQASKPGYLSYPGSDTKVTSSGRFDYAVGTNPHLPDRSSPVIFRLYKVGPVEPLVHIGEKSFRIARDGSPLTVSVNGQGTQRVVMRCWTYDLNRPEGQHKYDWKFEISIPNGGLQARGDAFVFEAPTQGYVPEDTVDMPASLHSGFGGWDDSAERAYFIRFDDGTFARANLRMRAGGSHFVEWESFFNPKVGSRNLESNPENQSASR